MSCIVCVFREEIPDPVCTSRPARYDTVLVAALVAGMTLKEPLSGICPSHNVMVHSCVAAVTREDNPEVKPCPAG